MNKGSRPICHSRPLSAQVQTGNLLVKSCGVLHLSLLQTHTHTHTHTHTLIHPDRQTLAGSWSSCHPRPCWSPFTHRNCIFSGLIISIHPQILAEILNCICFLCFGLLSTFSNCLSHRKKAVRKCYSEWINLKNFCLAFRCGRGKLWHKPATVSNNGPSTLTPSVIIWNVKVVDHNLLPLAYFLFWDTME